MVEIYMENLPAEYQKKLCARALTRETIEGLAGSVSTKYMARRRIFRKLAVILPAMTVLMALLSLYAPAVRTGNVNTKVLLGSYGFTVLVEILILVYVYFLSVVRVPRQFAKCLKKGYPELESLYGYEQLTNGSLIDNQAAQWPSFSLQIEDVFKLKNSEDCVAVGFAHGLIERGNYVRVLDTEQAAQPRGAALVSGIEIANGKAAEQAADCKAALRVRGGAGLGLAPGMYLRRS